LRQVDEQLRTRSRTVGEGRRNLPLDMRHISVAGELVANDDPRRADARERNGVRRWLGAKGEGVQREGVGSYRESVSQ
jgi:hypothetical protein